MFADRRTSFGANEVAGDRRSHRAICVREAATEKRMIHHIGVFASDFRTSRDMYRAALAPLGVVLGYETADVAEFWRANADTPSLSLERAVDEATTGMHLAFSAPDRASVDEFFRAALSAGGHERHGPRYWPEYLAYCAFVSDLD